MVHVELAKMTPTQAYRDDPSVIRPALEMIIPAKGLRGLWHGLQVEDERNFYMTVAWDSVEDHYAFMADKENWNKCAKVYGAAAHFDITIRDSLFHVPFNSDPYVHMNMPVTEFTVMELKPGKDAAAVESVIQREAAERQALLDDGRHSRGVFTWGCPREIPGVYVLMTGWDSLEDSDSFRAQYAERLAKFMASLEEIADGSTTRYRLKKFE